jgi:hypothetical protein
MDPDEAEPSTAARPKESRPVERRPGRSAPEERGPAASAPEASRLANDRPEKARPGGPWLRRVAVAGYLGSVTLVIILLVALGEDVLAGWLAAVEVFTSMAIAIALRRTPSPAASATHRLGTPRDPGMPSGR